VTLVDPTIQSAIEFVEGNDVHEEYFKQSLLKYDVLKATKLSPSQRRKGSKELPKYFDTKLSMMQYLPVVVHRSPQRGTVPSPTPTSRLLCLPFWDHAASCCLFSAGRWSTPIAQLFTKTEDRPVRTIPSGDPHVTSGCRKRIDFPGSGVVRQ
jgi:hypothetical protein